MLIGVTGFEPNAEFVASKDGSCNCDFCQGFRAARALQRLSPDCLELATNDTDFRQAIQAWQRLDAAAKAAIAANLD